MSTVNELVDYIHNNKDSLISDIVELLTDEDYYMSNGLKEVRTRAILLDILDSKYPGEFSYNDFGKVMDRTLKDIYTAVNECISKMECNKDISDDYEDDYEM